MRRMQLLAILIVFAVSTGFAQTPYVPNIRAFENADELSVYLHWSAGCDPLISAHRGGPLPGYPENAIETFENIQKLAPCLIECDVRKTSDGALIMLHDDTLDRTTTGKGKLIDHDLSEIRKLRLVDNDGDTTGFRIPLFTDVLRWAKGRAVLTVDVKRPVAWEEVVRAIETERVEGQVVVIVYTVDQAVEVHRLNPGLMISVPGQNQGVFELLKKMGIPADRMVAFVGTKEPERAVFEQWHNEGVRTILGTMGNLDSRAATKGVEVYRELYHKGADILSTDRVPSVVEARNGLEPGARNP